jgi:hypothetical protein
MSGVRGYDNLYNESVNDIALMNYNKGIANRLRMQEQQMQNKLPFKEPQMLSGGVRASNSIVAGTTAEPPSTLAVGGRAFRTFTGNEKPSQGGVNRLKKANRYLDFSKKVVGDAFNIMDQSKARGGMVYSQDLKDALSGCGDCSGGAKKPRKPRTARFVKGSQEAKDFMASIRAKKAK